VTHSASLSRYGKAYVTLAQAKECLRKAGYIVTKPRAQRTQKVTKSKDTETILRQRNPPHDLPLLTAVHRVAPAV
jgi:hypothetical protein